MRRPVGASSGHDCGPPKSRDMDLIGFDFPRAPGKKKRFPSEFHLQFFWSHLPLAGRAEVGRHFNPVVGLLSGVKVLEPKGTEFSEPTLVLQLWILPKGALTPLHHSIAWDAQNHHLSARTRSRAGVAHQETSSPGACSSFLRCPDRSHFAVVVLSMFFMILFFRMVCATLGILIRIGADTFWSCPRKENASQGN